MAKVSKKLTSHTFAAPVCEGCGHPMAFKVPCQGSAVGFVHAETGKEECVEPAVPRYRCTACYGPTRYDEKFDSVFCPACNIWLEARCGDPECCFCPGRPERPLRGVGRKISGKGKKLPAGYHLQPK